MSHLIRPRNAVTVRAKSCQAVAYVGSARDGERVHVTLYAGKANNPTGNYTFRTQSRAAEWIAAQFDAQQRREAVRAARKAERKAFRHTLKVGDVLRSSWGYDQTNIDFYQVVEVRGADVMVRELAQQSQETMSMQGECVPHIDNFVGPATRHRVLQNNCIKSRRCAYAYLHEPQVIGGAKVFAPSHWTAYH